MTAGRGAGNVRPAVARAITRHGRTTPQTTVLDLPSMVPA